MSDTSDQMTGALTNIEAALQGLATAYAAFEDGRSTAKRARARELGDSRAEDIDNACSTAHLDRLIAGRMCALGLRQVLRQTPAAVGAEAVTRLSAAVRQAVR